MPIAFWPSPQNKSPNLSNILTHSLPGLQYEERVLSGQMTGMEVGISILLEENACFESAVEEISKT